MKLQVLGLALTLLLTFISKAQDSCSCSSSFEKIVQKIEENYIGYALQKQSIDKSYQLQVMKFREQSKTTSEESCTALLQRFLQFFKDGHLFAAEYPNYKSEELLVFKQAIQQKKYNLSDAIKQVKQNSTKGIEGFWTDGNSVFAIIKNTDKSSAYQYAAVVIYSAQKDKEGELKFGLNFNNGLYEGTYYSNAYAPRFINVKLYKKNSLLSISGGILWGRMASFQENEIANRTLTNPQLPTLAKLNEETLLLTISTFLIEAAVFNKFLMDNFAALTTTKNLVIDIRGNTGGNGIYFDLMNFYAVRPIVSDTGYAIASADNIAYFKKFASKNRNDPYRPVVEDMEKQNGTLVDGPRFRPKQITAIPSSLKKVIIITDESNMSAAETFILFSKASSDIVTTIGKNTGGVVDYNNINMIKVGCEKRGIQFGYPTYSLNKRVVQNGYNKKGISPDIYSDKQSDELYQFILNYLKR